MLMGKGGNGKGVEIFWNPPNEAEFVIMSIVDGSRILLLFYILLPTQCYSVRSEFES